ncbi:MAG: hypothetical protein R3C59_00785 [Planctomycetaceae bacterium]
MTLTLLFLLIGIADAQDSALPFVGSDTVVVHRDGERVEQMSGRIEDISGETLTLRRNGRADIRLLRMSDVTSLVFSRSSVFEQGLQLLEKRDEVAALRYFDAAIESEPREWAGNELQAVAVKACIRAGDRDAAVDRIEKILEIDSASRHVSLLPLVWDARLPVRERVTARADDLTATSAVRQLVAASAFLGDPAHHQSAVLILQKLRTLPYRRLAELAETQMWRLPVLTDDEQHVALIRLWESRLPQLPLEARGGPQFAFARCLQKQHDYDKASIAFLWQPFMIPTDEALAAAAMAESIRCLQASGRNQSATVLSQELQQRFPKMSAAQALATESFRP